MAIGRRLMVFGGIVAGILTLRSIRKRRKERKQRSEAREELETAGDHATAAYQHARQAASKAMEERQKA